MPKNHLKIECSPKTWPINRKVNTFTTRPNPGGSNRDMSIPINIILRNLLGKAKTTKEAKRILHVQEILVNGTRRKDYRYPVAFMDVLSIPIEDEHYLMLINKKNKLYLSTIDKKESETKLSKITSKKLLGKDKVQLGTLDGRTAIVKKDTFKTGDTVVFSFSKKQEIKNHLKLEKGAKVLLFKGSHVGTFATITEISGSTIKVEYDKKEYETKKDYAFVVGDLVKTK